MIFSAAATRRLAVVSPLLAVGLLASGCMSSPTYGTGVTANEQLVNDVTSIVSLGPKRKEAIDYKPRPDLVRPAKGQLEDLPAPQESVASTDNADWPESPEQRRQRIRKNADANRDNPNYQPEVVNDIAGVNDRSPPLGASPRYRESGVLSASESAARSAEIKQRLAESRQGSATQRKYLSEPPLAYRQPADTAAADELGEDQLKKERRAKKAATAPKGIKDYIPWL